MKLEDIKSIGIVGAGTMGSGIAQMSAMAGYKTTIFDIQEAALEKAKAAVTKNLDKGIEKGKVSAEQKEACLSNISFISNLEDLKADVIIEAVVEKLQVKIDIFSQLEKINGDKTILATNTSSIPITQIGAGLQKPDRLVGMHFFNPAHIMKLVEVISGAATNPQIAETTKALAEKMGKKAVMAKDSPGFIVNRVARHFYVESLKIAEENVADFKQIDRLVESSGFKMGPFKLMDLIGVDTNFSVTQSMFESFYYDSKFRPSRIQQQKVDAGHHGRKSGKGFYDYN
ncbi:3-hydroxyacyl-CoA dehydrogenase NAD-binding domain-containing protein [Marivirga arenosa]|uniref:3-hydroxyacyl-CoA dehydrogenase NAD-binding domain-containing protein n=1 Tax=Marivirga arenosa TaxID=3059076 RepID=A0AA49GIY1_9BACT|nr:3-hydroxyacyl-CoA dehydrogenase NAD-binding domain-containing protein [Marivirga sp. ABR2-2]WKK86506.2 3-hydroxyacyl-CoA dehydrogenase NAD-binding domain-containing protein [Marivirga sp. ABR2-2]